MLVTRGIPWDGDQLVGCHDVSGLLETVQPDTAPQYCELKHRNGRISPESPVLSVSE